MVMSCHAGTLKNALNNYNILKTLNTLSNILKNKQWACSEDKKKELDFIWQLRKVLCTSRLTPDQWAYSKQITDLKTSAIFSVWHIYKMYSTSVI